MAEFLKISSFVFCVLVFCVLYFMFFEYYNLRPTNRLLRIFHISKIHQLHKAPPIQTVQSNSLLRFKFNQMLWLVSAYVDPRYKNMVRVIAAGNRSLMKYRPRCNFFHEGRNASWHLINEYAFNMPAKEKYVR